MLFASAAADGAIVQHKAQQAIFKKYLNIFAVFLWHLL